MDELKKGDRVQYIHGTYLSRSFGRVVAVVEGEVTNDSVTYAVKWDNEGHVDTTTYPSLYLRKVDQ